MNSTDSLKKVVSEINVSEARLRQLEKMEIDYEMDYSRNKCKLKEDLVVLYKKKEDLLELSKSIQN